MCVLLVVFDCGVTCVISNLNLALCDQLGPDALENAFRLAIGEVVGVVVSRRNFNQPVDLDYKNVIFKSKVHFTNYLDIGHSSNVVLRRQHKLIVHNPVRLVIETGGGVQLDNLIVLYRQIMAGFFLKQCNEQLKQ